MQGCKERKEKQSADHLQHMVLKDSLLVVLMFVLQRLATKADRNAKLQRAHAKGTVVGYARSALNKA